MANDCFQIQWSLDNYRRKNIITNRFWSGASVDGFQQLSGAKPKKMNNSIFTSEQAIFFFLEERKALKYQSIELPRTTMVAVKKFQQSVIIRKPLGRLIGYSREQRYIGVIGNRSVRFLNSTCVFVMFKLLLVAGINDNMANCTHVRMYRAIVLSAT